ncbi:hypothetical protein N1851_026368 [Merluccius polli]|uniref:HECT domain-containing protein n=1 Tax=Merluccius polli TaxID=89951 RepID=A0AA47MC14_MERPO|nr:hypothetical protein N1851_026368 [Merluccius polli]
MSDTDEVVESALKFLFWRTDSMSLSNSKWRCCVGGGGQGEQSDAEPVLMFVTGADRVPPLGFPGEPNIKLFAHWHCPSRKQTPCALILKLPLHTTYESFSDSMISGIIQTPVLGIHA